MKQIVGLVLMLCCTQMLAQEVFPDGKVIPDWFRENKEVNVNALGKKYSITNYGVVNDSTIVQTKKIQEVIDLAARNGGGVIVIPKGTFLSGSLFFKNNTHLHLEENAVLKGSDDISHFPVKMTRMEGQTLKYFMALVNADGLDGFTISGKGTLNGNGLRYWKSFWLRRSINPDCTNMEEMRPRIIYLSNCKNTQIEGIRIMNSPFWSTHFYKCSFLKLLNLRITSPASPVKAPSKDKRIIFCDDSIVRGTQLHDNVKILFDYGAKEVHMRIGCPPLIYGCPFIGFTASKSDMELITRQIIKELEGDENKNLDKYATTGSPEYEKMVGIIAKRFGLSSLKFNTIETLIEAIGLPKCKVCTHCFDGSSCF